MLKKLLLKSARPLSFAYPVLVWLGRDNQTWLLGLAAVLGAVMIHDLSERWSRLWLLLAVGLIAASALLVGLYDQANIVRLYPFLISLSVLNIFVSAKTPEANPMIGPLGRLVAKDPELLLLLHRAKGFWIWGLALNSCVLGVFLFAFDLKTWALYASFYS